jgi:hypothetical protein
VPFQTNVRVEILDEFLYVMVAGVYPENEVRSAGRVRVEILDEFRYVRVLTVWDDRRNS